MCYLESDDMESENKVDINKDRLIQLLRVACEQYCSMATCSGTGCRRCMTSKLSLTEKEYSVIFDSK